MSSLNIPKAASSIFMILGFATGNRITAHSHLWKYLYFFFLCWEYPRNDNVMVSMLLIFLQNVHVGSKTSDQMWSLCNCDVWKEKEKMHGCSTHFYFCDLKSSGMTKKKKKIVCIFTQRSGWQQWTKIWQQAPSFGQVLMFQLGEHTPLCTTNTTGKIWQGLY